MKTPQQLRNEFWRDDIAKGGVIRSQYDKIKEVLAHKDGKWVEQQLHALKKHAIAHTEFYKLFSADAQFPVVDKMSLMAEYEAHKANADFDLPLHVSSTSGSTGTPFSVIQNRRKRMRNIADIKVFGELCNYPSHERMVFFRVLSEKLHRTPEQEDRENIYYIDSSDLGDKHLDEMMQVLLDKKPRIVFSYASTLVELAKYIQKTGVEPSAFSMQSVLTGGEGISEEDRALLGTVFGCEVYRRYSNMEMGILGQDMGGGSSYVLNWGSYYFECLKEDADVPAAPGEVGRIVITDLFNYAFPMIRYDTGDLGVMEYPTDDFPRLREIYGRKRDCVYATDGRLLSPAKISVTMWGRAGISQWQFIQEDRARYTLKLNGDPASDTSAITRSLLEVLGTDARLDVVWVDEIPVTSSNKRRAVICNYVK